ncbi:Large ribosomal subunit protein uL4c [Cardamine amara subsp. amara]|uniref:Large ribosomal subunit protein uL4c n=1 Tax=Cardamine amara subsp. amara TaxID=228776 RepID=A0ABD1A5C0_CARAN
MASSATAPNSLSFFSSSLFLSSSHQIPKTYISVAKFGFGKVSKPLSVASQLATLPIISFEGEKVGETYLDLKTAPEDTARAVVHRAIVTDLQNKRRGTASTLTRGEVRGGGIKPYAQKKTGNARRGSQRTPLRPGGGVVFGPRPKDWSIKINRKEKKLAISTAISSAASAEGGAIVVEEFGEKFEKPKTKDFLAAMKRNIGTLRMLTPRTLNLFDILNSDKLVLTPAAVDFLNARYGVDALDEEDEDDTEGSEEAAA